MDDRRPLPQKFEPIETTQNDETQQRGDKPVPTYIKYTAEMMTGERSMEAPMLVMADSYKAAHYAMYPDAKVMIAYGEFRKSMDGMDDDRIVVYGIRHYIEQFINRVIKAADVDAAKLFYTQHMAPGFTQYPFPDKIFEHIRKTGHLPIKIEALPEGSVVYPHTPVYILTATEENSHFCTFLETLLTMIWYPSTVATLSRQTKKLIEAAFEKSVDPGKFFKLDSRLHDFGFRGCTCVEQSVLGGTAHLLSFTGSDTMSACYHAQYHLNYGVPVGNSIPATEHSVMTAWTTEIEAIRNLLTRFKGADKDHLSLVACVMDSYDYENALNTLLPQVIKDVIDNNCFLILRPDSGDPVKQVIKGLKAAKKALLSLPNGQNYVNLNEKNYWVLDHLGVIQGDGINYGVIKEILDAVMEEGFAAENVAFGMGGGLLQKVNRDTMSFATKLSYIKYTNAGDGENGEKHVMKRPATDRDKWSLPGKVKVLRQYLIDDETDTPLKDSNDDYVLGPHIVFTEVAGNRLLKSESHVDSMSVIYDHGKDTGFRFESFDEIRARLNKQWSAFRPHMTALDSTIIMKQDRIAKGIKDNLTKMQPTKSIFTIEPYKLSDNDLKAVPAPRSLASNLHRLDELLSRLA